MTASITDQGHAILSVLSVAPIASTGATHNGVAVDRIPSSDQSFRSGLLEVSIGAATGSPTALTVDCSVQESADGSTGWAAITAGHGGPIAMTQATAGSQVVQVPFTMTGTYRYLRAVVVTTLTAGTSPTLPVAANIVLAGARKVPAQ